jgi:hypothetical protein
MSGRGASSSDGTAWAAGARQREGDRLPLGGAQFCCEWVQIQVKSSYYADYGFHQRTGRDSRDRSTASGASMIAIRWRQISKPAALS